MQHSKYYGNTSHRVDDKVAVTYYSSLAFLDQRSLVTRLLAGFSVCLKAFILLGFFAQFLSPSVSANGAPKLLAIPPQTVVPEQPFSYRIAIDTQGESQAAVRLINAPNGATIADNGDGSYQLRWTPPESIGEQTIIIVQAFNTAQPSLMSTQRVLLERTNAKENDATIANVAAATKDTTGANSNAQPISDSAQIKTTKANSATVGTEINKAVTGTAAPASAKPAAPATSTPTAKPVVPATPTATAKPADAPATPTATAKPAAPATPTATAKPADAPATPNATAKPAVPATPTATTTPIATATPATTATRAASTTPAITAKAKLDATATVKAEADKTASLSETAVPGGKTKPSKAPVSDVNSITSRRPDLPEIGVQRMIVGEDYQFIIRPIISDDTVVQLSAQNLPVGATFDDVFEGSKMLRWTPTTDQIGEHQMTLILVAEDDRKVSLRTEREVIFIVNPEPLVPSEPELFFEPMSAQIVSAGRRVNIRVEPTLTDGKLAYLHVDRLPAGGSFDENKDGTRTFHWPTTQADQGEHTFRFTAIHPDNTELVASVNVLIVVGSPDGSGGTGPNVVAASPSPELDPELDPNLPQASSPEPFPSAEPSGPEPYPSADSPSPQEPYPTSDVPSDVASPEPLAVKPPPPPRPTPD